MGVCYELELPNTHANTDPLYTYTQTSLFICSLGNRKIKGVAWWLYLIYHGQYEYFSRSHITQQHRSNKMVSSKNARKIKLLSFSNALSFASGDFHEGSTT